MTNFERIKAMGVEEMALFLNEHVGCLLCPMIEYCKKARRTNDIERQYCNCVKAQKKWLKSEVDEDD